MGAGWVGDSDYGLPIGEMGKLRDCTHYVCQGLPPPLSARVGVTRSLGNAQPAPLFVRNTNFLAYMRSEILTGKVSGHSSNASWGGETFVICLFPLATAVSIGLSIRAFAQLGTELLKN